jgi:hypothetical protein
MTHDQPSSFNLPEVALSSTKEKVEMELFPIPQYPIQGDLDTIDDGQASPWVKERGPLAEDLNHAPDVDSVRHRQCQATARIVDGGGEHAMNGHDYTHDLSRLGVGMPILPLSQAASKR